MLTCSFSTRPASKTMSPKTIQNSEANWRRNRNLSQNQPHIRRFKRCGRIVDPSRCKQFCCEIQYINGHFSCAQRAAVVTNGLGIVRHLELFDGDFCNRYQGIPREQRSKSPEIDKEICDFTALKPFLADFRAAHPIYRDLSIHLFLAFPGKNTSILSKRHHFTTIP